jgi:hypothetical protein
VCHQTDAATPYKYPVKHDNRVAMILIVIAQCTNMILSRIEQQTRKFTIGL